MTKSRTAPGLILLALTPFPPASAQTPPAAEAAIEAQRAEVRAIVARPCPAGGDEEEIVVCGRRDDEPGVSEYRLPLPVAREPGARIRGEAPPMRECLRLCHQPLTIDVIGATRSIMRAVDRLLHDN